MTKSIWVVDDEPLIRAAVVAVLNELGHEARGFEGAEPLYVALVDGARPDLLILDHMLPDESGAVIVRSLRERSEYRDIPVLFLTAVSDDEADRLEDLAPVVRKPFDFRDLVAAVDKRLTAAEESDDREEALVLGESGED
ncbi:MAG: response regulator transcription factor [Candidatus Limnocylindria bacterium]